MKRSPDRLYQLLPVIYRLRDAEQGEPLKALLRVVNEQIDLVEADIAQLYDNWFIETCEAWVVPYIGDLPGYRILHDSGEPQGVAMPSQQERERILIPRRDVANTISSRRRKGTLALLELLARGAAGYPARAVEFYKRLGITQNINFPHSMRGRTIDLRDGHTLELLNTPFDRSSYTIDIRRTLSGRSRGLYNIPSAALFVWRLKTYSVTETPAYCLEDEGNECYTFSANGHDTQLYNRPQAETEPTQIADELNLPTPIRRRAFEERIIENGEVKRTMASEKYYGKSVTIFLITRNGSLRAIPREAIIPANLSNWQAYSTPKNFVAVDPELGRIVFPQDQKPKYGVAVSYYYAFSANIGGGEYSRALSQPHGAKVYRVGKGEPFATIKDGLDAWEKERPRAAVIEIQDSDVYGDRLRIELQAGESLQIRAANRKRPIIRLADYKASLPDALSVSGEQGSRLILDGLLITGRPLRITGPENSLSDDYTTYESRGAGDLCDVTIRHCTLVPGWSLHCDCEPHRPNEPSLEIEYTHARINIEHSITGAIHVEANERASEPQVVQISDSILDATSETRVALGGGEGRLAYVTFSASRSTIIGKIRAHAIELAENSIFSGVVTIGRRQHGCVRFCYLAPGSRTPRRYHCQPDLVEQAAETALRDEALKANKPKPMPAEIDEARESARQRVEPKFNSVRYGNPTYCQLTQTCADEITRGADDESEMGAFHDLYQPQRATNLRARLDEYTPAGAEVGIIFAS